jgi:hypothetical protein
VEAVYPGRKDFDTRGSNGKAVSTVANNHELNPKLILNWQKQMVENAQETFTIKRSDISDKVQE